MNGKVKRVFVLITIIALLITTSGCANTKRFGQDDEINISVIVKKKDAGFWEVVKMGAQVASKEFNVNLTFDAPDNEQDIDVQIGMVEEAIKTADALVLAAADYNALIPVVEQAKDEGLPVIIIDSALDSDVIDCFVGTDNIEAGKKLGESLVDKVGERCSIAIMSFVKGAATANQREMGLRQALSMYPYVEIVDTLYCNSDEQLAEQLAREMIASNPDIDAFVCLNAYGTLGTARAIDRLNIDGEIKIIGFDGTRAEISYLEKGVIQSLVVQNPFNMGYLGVKYAVDILFGKEVPNNLDTGSTVIDIDNMYLPENQKLVFTFDN